MGRSPGPFFHLPICCMPVWGVGRADSKPSRAHAWLKTPDGEGTAREKSQQEFRLTKGEDSKILSQNTLDASASL